MDRSRLRRAGLVPGLVVVLATAALAGCGERTGLGSTRQYRLAQLELPFESPEGVRMAALYPDLFAGLETNHGAADLDVRLPRRDLLVKPSVDRSYDALNALAIVFFELHRRAEQGRDGAGFAFLTQNLRASQVLSVSWRSYRDVEDRRLRGAIVDFYQDLLLGQKTGMRGASGRYVDTVESLLRWESDEPLRGRIQELVEAGREIQRRVRSGASP